MSNATNDSAIETRASLGAPTSPPGAKREDDTEGFVEKSAERSVRTEQQQQQVTGHDRWHHERQVNHAVEQALAVKPAARQNDCRCQPKGQAADHCPERDAQAQAHRLYFGRAEIQHQAHASVTDSLYSSERAEWVRQDHGPNSSGRGRLHAVGRLTRWL